MKTKKFSLKTCAVALFVMGTFVVNAQTTTIQAEAPAPTTYFTNGTGAAPNTEAADGGTVRGDVRGPKSGKAFGCGWKFNANLIGQETLNIRFTANTVDKNSTWVLRTDTLTIGGLGVTFANTTTSVLGTVDLIFTGSWSNYTTTPMTLTGTPGTIATPAPTTLYLVCTSGPSTYGVGNFNWFSLVKAAVVTTPPTVPTALVASGANWNGFKLSWTISTEIGGGGVGGYAIYKNGLKIDSVSADEHTYFVTGLVGGASNSYTVKSKSAVVGYFPTAASTPLVFATPAKTDLYAYEDFATATSGGTGWSSNWTGGAITPGASSLLFGTLATAGFSGTSAQFNATREFPFQLDDFNALYISYLCQESALAITRVNITCGAKSVTFSNGELPTGFQTNSYSLMNSEWVGKITEAGESAGGTTFNLLKIDPSGEVTRWVYDTPANLPTTEPVDGTGALYYSGAVVNVFGADYKKITKISLSNPAQLNTGGVAFDEFRIGGTFAAVVPLKAASAVKNTQLEGVKVFVNDGKVSVNGLNGASTVTVMDAKGSVVSSVKSNDTQVSINLSNRGIYLVRIQNNGQIATTKVAF